MKKFIISGVVLSFLFLFQPQLAYSQGMMGNYFDNPSSPSPSSSQPTEQQYEQNLQSLVNSLLSSQKASSVNQLNCQKIPKDEFEKIGDAWMDVRIGNEQAHEAMDNMMGGEGSQSLKEAHIQMGENYLGCPLSGNSAYNWMPMMFGTRNTAAGGGVFPMMGWGGYGWTGMMNGGVGTGVGTIAFLFWLVAFIDLVLLGIFLWKRIRK